MLNEERICKHADDPWADTIILNGVRSLRLVIRERYKTSELSGDEWRFSYIWQVFGSEWTDLDGSSQEQYNEVVGQVGTITYINEEDEFGIKVRVPGIDYMEFNLGPDEVELYSTNQWGGR